MTHLPQLVFYEITALPYIPKLLKKEKSKMHTKPPKISKTHTYPPKISKTHTYPPKISKTHTYPPKLYL